jgi:hypothetical protein
MKRLLPLAPVIGSLRRLVILAALAVALASAGCARATPETPKERAASQHETRELEQEDKAIERNLALAKKASERVHASER